MGAKFRKGDRVYYTTYGGPCWGTVEDWPHYQYEKGEYQYKVALDEFGRKVIAPESKLSTRAPLLPKRKFSVRQEVIVKDDGTHGHINGFVGVDKYDVSLGAGRRKTFAESELIAANSARPSKVVANALNAVRNGYVKLYAKAGGTATVYEGDKVEYDGKVYTAKALGSPSMDSATLVDDAGNKLVVKMKDYKLKALNFTPTSEFEVGDTVRFKDSVRSVPHDETYKVVKVSGKNITIKGGRDNSTSTEFANNLEIVENADTSIVSEKAVNASGERVIDIAVSVLEARLRGMSIPGYSGPYKEYNDFVFKPAVTPKGSFSGKITVMPWPEAETTPEDLKAGRFYVKVYTDMGRFAPRAKMFNTVDKAESYIKSMLVPVVKKVTARNAAEYIDADKTILHKGDAEKAVNAKFKVGDRVFVDPDNKLEGPGGKGTITGVGSYNDYHVVLDEGKERCLVPESVLKLINSRARNASSSPFGFFVGEQVVIKKDPSRKKYRIREITATGDIRLEGAVPLFDASELDTANYAGPYRARNAKFKAGDKAYVHWLNGEDELVDVISYEPKGDYYIVRGEDGQLTHPKAFLLYPVKNSRIVANALKARNVAVDVPVKFEVGKRYRAPWDRMWLCKVLSRTDSSIKVAIKSVRDTTWHPTEEQVTLRIVPKASIEQDAEVAKGEGWEFWASEQAM